MVVRALKVIMKRAIVDEVDQEAGTVGGVHDGGDGLRFGRFGKKETDGDDCEPRPHYFAAWSLELVLRDEYFNLSHLLPSL